MALSRSPDTAVHGLQERLESRLAAVREQVEAGLGADSDAAAAFAQVAAQLDAIPASLSAPLPGIAALSTEMARLAGALGENPDVDRDEGCVTLVAATWQLASYAEYLDDGHADRPLALLDLINQLRGVRQTEPLEPGGLLEPDNAATPTLEGRDAESFLARLSGWRTEYQSALLGYLSPEGEKADGLRRLASVFSDMTAAAPEPWTWRLAVAGQGLVAGLEQGAVAFEGGSGRLLRRVDRELRRLATEGLTTWTGDPPRLLAGGLALPLAGVDVEDPRIVQAQQVYQLARQVPSNEEQRRIQAVLGGLGSETWTRVQDALGEDFAQAKELIDIHVRSGSSEPDDLAQARDLVGKVGDTLRLLGRAGDADHISTQLERFDNSVEAASTSDVLLDVARDLLAVERRVLGKDTETEGGVRAEPREIGIDAADADAAGMDADTDGLDLAATREAALDQCLVDLMRAKELVESSQDAADGLGEARQLVRRVGEVCRMLDLAAPTSLAGAVADYMDQDFAVASAGGATGEIQQGLNSLDQALRRLRDGAEPDMGDINARVEALAVTVMPVAQETGPGDAPADSPMADQTAAPEPAELEAAPAAEAGPETAPAAEAGPETAPAAEAELDSRDIAAREEASEPAQPPESVPGEPQATPDASVAHGSYAGGAGLDPEVAEIFIEEADEILETLDALLPVFEANSADHETLGDIRRAFHTLKGSGRLAGAVEMGDFAYAVENLLNRVLDESIEPGHEALAGFVRDARNAVPAMLEHFRNGGPAPIAAGELIARADDILAGTHAQPPATGAGVEPHQHDAGTAATDVPAADLASSVGTDDGADAAGSEPPSGGLGAGASRDDGVPSEPGSASEPAGTGGAGAATASVGARSNGGAEGSQESPVDSVFDPMLLEIFISEANQHLRSIDEFAANVRAADSAFEVTVDAPVIQAAHTLQGSAYMAGMRAIGELARAFELLLREHARQQVSISTELTGLISETGEAVRALVTYLGESGREGSPPEALIGRLKDARRLLIDGTDDEEAAAPVHKQTDESADEIVDVFLEEAGDLMEEIEAAAANWRSQPGDADAEFALSRALHTLKGSARTVGMSLIGSLVHALEAAVIGTSQASADQQSEFFALLDETLENLGEQVERLAIRGEVEPIDDLLERLEAYVEGGSGPSRGGAADASHSPTAQPAPMDSPAAAAEDARDAEMPAPPDPDEQPEPGPGEGGPSAGGRERLRVSAELLDRLSNEAAEVAVAGGRITQHMSSVRFNLGELERTISRLRDQLRRMEVETESQIMARYEPELDPHAAEFDPLEMDRYSHLQQLSRGLAETAGDLAELQTTLEQETRAVESGLQQQSRQSGILQEGLLSTRMVPFSSLLTRLRRVVRRTGTEVGKKVELRAAGVWESLDRRVLERISSPLEHLMRNAVDHGIEPPEARRALGKPETGTITVQVRREGAQAVVVIRDDGAGLNQDRIAARARELGLLGPEEAVTPARLTQILVDSGFSTATEISEISGRGVGLGAVNAVAKELGGQFDIDSAPGRGTWFTLRLPLALAMTRSLFVAAGGEQYGVLMNSINMVAREHGRVLEGHLSGEDGLYHHRGTDYRVITLAMLVDGKPSTGLDPDYQYPLLLVNRGEENWALIVDELLSSREVVVKSVGAQITTVPGIAGATIMANGEAVLILDMTARLPMADRKAADLSAMEGTEDRTAPILVVDDSITVRRFTARLLERHRLHVRTAKDGVDASAILQNLVPSVVVLDIEMPRMDGYEVASHIRNDSRLADVPIIMVTSRGGEKHRKRAMELGATHYLTKPYQEHELLQTIETTLGRRIVEPESHAAPVQGSTPE